MYMSGFFRIFHKLYAGPEHLEGYLDFRRLG